MLFPPTGPRSSCRALGFRLSYENFERKPWADTRSGRTTARRIAARQTARPPDRLTASVKALNIGPRKVGGDDRAVVLTRPGPARGRLAGHFDVRDALQPATVRVHHRGKRPRQYSAQLGAIPFLAPAEPRGELAVVVAAPGRVRDRAQVGLRLGGFECLVCTGGREPAGRVEVGVDQIAAIAQHLPPGGTQRAPHVGRLAPDPGVDLVPYIGPSVEALRFPAAPVLERERPRHHGLREHRLAFVGSSWSQLPADDTREVTLDRYAVHQGESRGIAQHVQPPTIPATVRHGEAALRDIHRGDAAAPLATRAVRLHESETRRVDDDRPCRTRRDRPDRLAIRVVGDEQLAIAPQHDAGRTGDETDAQLGLGPGGERSGLRPPTSPGEGESASEPALRPAPR